MTIPLRFARAARGGVALSLLSLAATSCGNVPSDAVSSQITDPAKLYGQLQVDRHAILMAASAPYDTLTLTAVPTNPAGNPLAGATGTPTYASVNPQVAQVDADGILHAFAPGTTQIIARLTIGALTHSDTVLVWVTDLAGGPAPVLTSFSVHPIPPDSAKRPMGGCIGCFPDPTLPTQALDADGNAMSVPVYLTSSDPTVARFQPDRTSPPTPFSSQIMTLRPGTATLVGVTTAFGVTKTDTVLYRVGEAVAADIDVAGVQQGPRIGVGGYVVWRKGRLTTDGLDVLFDDPASVSAPIPVPGTLVGILLNFVCPPFGVADCSGGNITGAVHLSADSADAGNLGAIRTFPSPGKYTYKVVRHGTNGPAIVTGWVDVVAEE